jgi:hypothetical protein
MQARTAEACFPRATGTILPGNVPCRGHHNAFFILFTRRSRWRNGLIGVQWRVRILRSYSRRPTVPSRWGRSGTRLVRARDTAVTPPPLDYSTPHAGYARAVEVRTCLTPSPFLGCSLCRMCLAADGHLFPPRSDRRSPIDTAQPVPALARPDALERSRPVGPDRLQLLRENLA